MECANNAADEPPQRVAVADAFGRLTRSAQPDDYAAIVQLLDNAINVHFHADWQDLRTWIGQPGTVVHWRDGRLRGYLAATLDPPPVAWLRAIAIDQLDPTGIFEALCEQAIAALRAAGAQRLAALSSRTWSDYALKQAGFQATDEIEELARPEVAPPIMPGAAAGTEVSVRPARHDEFAALVTLDAAAFADPLWWHSAEQLAAAAQETVTFDVALVRGTLAGYQYSVRSDDRLAHIVRIAVDPRWRGYGVGSALMAQTLQTLWQLGLRRVTLNTQVDNRAARRLYDRFDFESTGTRFPVWTLEL